MSAVLQHDEAWLRTATPDQINAAYQAGELTAIVAVPAPERPEATAPEGQLDADTVKAMRPQEITEALDAGTLDHLLGRSA